MYVKFGSIPRQRTCIFLKPNSKFFFVKYNIFLVRQTLYSTDTRYGGSVQFSNISKIKNGAKGITQKNDDKAEVYS